MISIFFKKVNDTHGHNCGDYILRESAQIARLEAAHRLEKNTAATSNVPMRNQLFLV